MIFHLLQLYKKNKIRIIVSLIFWVVFLTKAWIFFDYSIPSDVSCQWNVFIGKEKLNWINLIFWKVKLQQMYIFLCKISLNSPS